LARELQDFVKTHAAPHKYPRAVVFVESLPKTTTGKIKRYRLRELAGELTPLHTQKGPEPKSP
jgi:acyl-coenzyme A synthetase/AMP-(fatty) acid ligase